MEDVQNIGGTPGLIKFLIDNNMFDGDQMTVTGKSHSQNLAELNHPGLTPGQQIIRPLSNPIKATGHLQIMYGNLCPGGGVAKITGKEGETFTVSAIDQCSKVLSDRSVTHVHGNRFPFLSVCIKGYGTRLRQ
jgi:dihydroxy-acid dehydratase